MDNEIKLRSASDCALICDVSETTWRSRVKNDPDAPKPVASDGRRALWSSDAVVAYARSARRQRQDRQKRRSRRGTGMQIFGRGQRRRIGPYRSVQLLEDPKAVAICYGDMSHYEVFRFATGEHGLFKINEDGVPCDTLMRFSEARDEMLDELRAWAAANISDEAEIWLYDKRG